MFWLALLVMLIGLVGTVLPILPGTPLIYIAILGYALYSHFTSNGFWFMLIMGLLTAASFAVDYLGSMYGARRYGASRWGIWGAVVGGVLGFVVMPPWGIILGPLLGASLSELVSGRNPDAALSVGWGTFVGLLSSTVIKFAIGLIMILTFVFKTKMW